MLMASSELAPGNKRLQSLTLAKTRMQVVDGFADSYGAANDYSSCTHNFPCFTTLVLQSQISIRKLGYLMGIGISKLQLNAIDMHVAI